jgi:hypothetical protein
VTCDRRGTARPWRGGSAPGDALARVAALARVLSSLAASGESVDSALVASCARLARRAALDVAVWVEHGELVADQVGPKAA